MFIKEPLKVKAVVRTIFVLCLLIRFMRLTSVVSGMLKVFSLDVYALLNLKATLSFITPYIAINFGVSPEQLLDPFSICNH